MLGGVAQNLAELGVGGLALRIIEGGLVHGLLLRGGYLGGLHPSRLGLSAPLPSFSSLCATPLTSGGQTVVASACTSASRPPSLAGTNLPQPTPSEYVQPLSHPQSLAREMISSAASTTCGAPTRAYSYSHGFLGPPSKVLTTPPACSTRTWPAATSQGHPRLA